MGQRVTMFLLPFVVLGLTKSDHEVRLNRLAGTRAARVAWSRLGHEPA
jgi:hypothetical protein